MAECKIIRITKTDNTYHVNIMTLSADGPKDSEDLGTFDDLNSAKQKITSDFPQANPGLRSVDDPENTVEKYMFVTQD